MDTTNPNMGRTEWNVQCERLMLYVDIMGFKALVKEDNNLANKLSQFIRNLERALLALRATADIRMTMFSDLIVVAANGNNVQQLNQLVKAAAIVQLLCKENGFPINGCIAKGSLSYEDIEEETKTKKSKITMPLFHGEAVINSYLLSEELFCYGVVLHPNTEEILEKDNKKTKTHNHPFVKCDIPLKSGGYVPLFYLSWTHVDTNVNNTSTSRKCSLDNYIKAIEALDNHNSTRVRAYIHNTIKLLENCRVFESQNQ